MQEQATSCGILGAPAVQATMRQPPRCRNADRGLYCTGLSTASLVVNAGNGCSVAVRPRETVSVEPVTYC